MLHLTIAKLKKNARCFLGGILKTCTALVQKKMRGEEVFVDALASKSVHVYLLWEILALAFLASSHYVLFSFFAAPHWNEEVPLF